MSDIFDDVGDLPGGDGPQEPVPVLADFTLDESDTTTELLEFDSWCFDCKHFVNDGSFTCAAFPDGIPDELLWDLEGHRRPYPGDHGIQFASRAQPAAVHPEVLRRLGVTPKPKPAE